MKPIYDPPVDKNDLVFNTVTLNTSFMNNTGMIKSILVRFIERTVNQIDSFPDLLEKADWNTCLINAHTIKGSSRTLGGVELGNAAENLEHACRDAKAEAVRVSLPPVEEAFSRFRKAAEQYLAQMG
jgi:HPt (histidine-containing phosphotransfer) domain-containing protein